MNGNDFVSTRIFEPPPPPIYGCVVVGGFKFAQQTIFFRDCMGLLIESPIGLRIRGVVVIGLRIRRGDSTNDDFKQRYVWVGVVAAHLVGPCYFCFARCDQVVEDTLNSLLHQQDVCVEPLIDGFVIGLSDDGVVESPYAV